MEFSCEECQRFELTPGEVEHFHAIIERLSRHLSDSEFDADDAKQEMWLTIFRTKRKVLDGNPPPDWPETSPRQRKYLEVALYRAAQECLHRDLPDGPMVRPGRVDPERTTLSRDE